MRKEQERLAPAAPADGAARRVLVTPYVDLAVDEARSRELARVRRFAHLGAMDHEDEPRPRLDPFDERTHAEADVHHAPLAAVLVVRAAAHASSSASRAVRRSAGI